MAGLFARFTQRFMSSVGGDADPARDDDEEVPQEEEDAAERLTILFRARGSLYKKTKGNEYTEIVPEAAIEIVMDTAASPRIALSMLVREATKDEDLLMRLSLTDAGVLNYHYPTVMWPCIVNGKVQRLAFNFIVSETSDGALTAERVAEKFVSVYRQCVYAAHVQKPPMLTEDVDDDVAYVISAFAAEDDGAAEPDPTPPPAAPAAGGVGANPARHFRSESVARTAPNAWLNDVSRFGRVMATKADGSLEFMAYNEAGLGESVVVKAAYPSGRAPVTKATDVVVAKQHTKAAMLSTDDGTSASVVLVDVETGATDEYLPGLEYQLAHLSLYGGRTDGGHPDLLVCSNTRSCFAIDTRLDPRKCAVVEDGKSLVDYTHAKRKDQTFTCHATSAAGFVATGDAVGQIRLFSGVPGSVKPGGKGHFPKIAKTLIVATAGHSIRHVDITADGQYILATTKQYLLVVGTKMPDNEKLGFTERMGAAKPLPTRLDVPAEVVAAIGQDFTLTHGTFGTDQETGEHVITCAAGRHIIVWELDAVKRAIPTRGKVNCVAEHVAVAPQLVAANDGHFAFIDESGVSLGQLPRRGKTCTRF